MCFSASWGPGNLGQNTAFLGKGAMGIKLVTAILPPENGSATGARQSSNNMYCASTTANELEGQQ